MKVGALLEGDEPNIDLDEVDDVTITHASGAEPNLLKIVKAQKVILKQVKIKKPNDVFSFETSIIPLTTTDPPLLEGPRKEKKMTHHICR